MSGAARQNLGTKPLLRGCSRGQKKGGLKRSWKYGKEPTEKEVGRKGGLWIKEDVKEGPGDLPGQASSQGFFFLIIRFGYLRQGIDM